jgi:hypothetical protein
MQRDLIIIFILILLANVAQRSGLITVFIWKLLANVDRNDFANSLLPKTVRKGYFILFFGNDFFLL